MLFSTGRPIGGAGVQYSLVHPNSTPWNVWYRGSIVVFCRSLWGALARLEDIYAAERDGRVEEVIG